MFAGLISSTSLGSNLGQGMKLGEAHMLSWKISDGLTVSSLICDRSSSSSSSDRVDSRGPLRQPRLATTTSLGLFSTNADGCTVTDLLDP